MKRAIDSIINFISRISGQENSNIVSNNDPGSLKINKKIIALKNIHKGKRCFVVGNGPSLNKMELNKLKNEYIFCTNAIFLLFPKIVWRPQFYTCVDTRVLPDRAPDIIRMHENNSDMLLFFPSELKDHAKNQVYETTRFIPPKKNRLYFKQVPIGESNLPFSAFSKDPSRVVVQPFSVTITALQFALFMGFDPIYLIGCDTSYKIPPTVKRSGGHPQLGDFLLTSTENDDPNHFCPDYFGKNRDWHDPQVEKMIWHYGMAKSVADDAGVTIYNATVGGNLEVFPRTDFIGLF